MKKSFDGIVVSGAREHNLKNVNVSIPRHKITVVTGLSGSGKSSLCFDTIYAEGQRRYVEGLSTYARNFLSQQKKPDVDSISGLSPAISIEQKTNSLSPRSTVGTVTEVYDYLRLLFARLGTPHCPTHKIPVASQNIEQIIDDITSMPDGTKLCILAPMATGKKGEFHKEFQKWLGLGYVRARVDGEYLELEKAGKLAKTKAHDIDLVIDRLILKKDSRTRVAQSVRNAVQLTNGYLKIEDFEKKKGRSYSMTATCPECDYNFPEIEPRLFSFNNPRGACEECNGLGYVEREADAETDDGEESEFVELYEEICDSCNGSRLKTAGLNVLLNHKNIAELSKFSSGNLLRFVESLKFKEREKIISQKIIEQLKHRLGYIEKVGVGYLSMDRSTKTLSGGEAQRVRLSSQLGSSLIGVLYVLDEPSIGLHPRDHSRMLEILKEIRDHGNTVLMVEHDEDTILDADLVIDLGPRAGVLGGHLQSQGTVAHIMKDAKSLTGQYLSGKKIVSPKRERRKSKQFLTLTGATGNNLKNLSLKIPTGAFTCVTGVSGSGKSTLIIDTLSRAMKNEIYGSDLETAPYKKIEGAENFDKVIHITQNPIGRTPRSNPSTYVGLFDHIRNLYAAHPESKLRGWTASRFSFNVKGGRCEACQGAGQAKIEMGFMANVYVLCDTCNGNRYNFETLKVRYKDKSIAEVLSMSFGEALDFFKNHSKIYASVETLNRVGLEYISLGQASTTLSGGEAQRIKLAKELSKRATGKTLYILDEPTTGLHFEDIKKLIELLHELTNQGNTVVVIEHNLDLVYSADHIIDLGPEGGDLGGEIVAEGTPEEITRITKSLTGQFLKKKVGAIKN